MRIPRAFLLAAAAATIGFPSYTEAQQMALKLDVGCSYCADARPPAPALVRRGVCEFGELRGPVGLPEVVERALCGNPQTAQAWANIKTQEALLAVERSAYLPNINAEISASRSTSKVSATTLPPQTTDPDDPDEPDESILQSSTTSNSESTRQYSMNLSWTLFDFGLRSANIDSARLLLRSISATKDSILQSVFLNAAQAYYDVLAAQAAVGANREAEEAAEENLRAAEAKRQAGLVAKADELQAKTAYMEASLNRLRAEGELKNLQGALAVAIGLRANVPVEVGTYGATFFDSALEQSVDALIEEAQSTQPTLIAARAQLDAAQRKVAAAKAEGMPTLSLTGNLSHVNSPVSTGAEVALQAQSETTRTRSIGLLLNIPLSDHYSRRHRIRSAEANVELKAAELKQAENQISLEIWQAYQTSHTETEQLAAADILLQSARHAYDVAKGRYIAGLGNIVELLGAQSALAGARQQHIRAQSNWRIAKFKLAASLGRLDPAMIR